MSSVYQVLLTSESSGQLWNTCVWDVNSGTHIATYKGGSSSPHTMCLLKQDYLLSAVANKPVINVWALQKREQIQQRIICPGQVTSLTCSPDGVYVVGAVQEKILVWQVSTGNLLAVIHKHYQTVRCLAFTDDGSHFISGADDNMVLVWPLWKVVDQLSTVGTSGIEPRHVWSQHSLPITCIHVGMGGIQARVFTASLDQTCKIWELASGALLCNVVYECSITSLVVDNGESKLYAGSHKGHIYALDLHKQPVKTEIHISDKEDAATSNTVFKGHSKQVTCLCMSLDGSVLISGSHDQDVRVWDVMSGQCVKTMSHKGNITNILVCGTPPGIQNPDYRAKLPFQCVKTMLHKGNITNILVCGTPPGIQNPDLRAKLPFQTFKRFLHNSEQSIDQHGEDTGTIQVRLTNTHKRKPEDIDLKPYLLDLEKSSTDIEETSTQDQSLARIEELEKQVEHLRSVNKQMYDVTVTKIMSEKS